jgi:hypothetical protein
MSRAYSTHGRYIKELSKFRSENLKRKSHFVGGKLGYNSKIDHTSMGCKGVYWISLEVYSVMRFCEKCNGFRFL